MQLARDGSIVPVKRMKQSLHCTAGGKARPHGAIAGPMPSRRSGALKDEAYWALRAEVRLDGRGDGGEALAGSVQQHQLPEKRLLAGTTHRPGTLHHAAMHACMRARPPLPSGRPWPHNVHGASTGAWWPHQTLRLPLPPPDTAPCVHAHSCRFVTGHINTGRGTQARPAQVSLVGCVQW